MLLLDPWRIAPVYHLPGSLSRNQYEVRDEPDETMVATTIPKMSIGSEPKSDRAYC